MKNTTGEPVLSYTHDYEVLSYHCDPYTNLRVSSLCIFMQEIAWLHSDRMQIGWKTLMENSNCFWALTRLKLELFDPPKWGDTITIKTWSRGTDGIQFFRDWQVFDSHGKIRAVGSSIWIIMSADTRHVQRNAHLAEKFPLQGEQVFPGKLKKIKPLTGPDFSAYSQIRYSELDVNRHMNNVSYLTRFLDEESEEFRSKYRIKEAELNFLRETGGGTWVRVGSEKHEDTKHYAIYRKRDEAELCRGKIVWQAREDSSEENNG